MSATSTVVMTSAEGVRFGVATGALCLDSVYTGGAGERARWETLHTGPTLSGGCVPPASRLPPRSVLPSS